MNDTTSEAAALQVEIYRKMSGEQRLKLAIEMSEFARELTLSRLRSEHPEWSDWELRRELLRYAFGSEPLPPILL